MSKIIYVDMDGILVDLVSAIQKRFVPKIPWEAGEYSLNKVFGLKSGYFENLQIEWWANLKKTDEADQIISMVQNYGELRIATVACSQLSIKGKFDWLKKYYPLIKDEHIFFVDSKHHLANLGTILIDDHTETVEKFIKAGGQAFLYPRHWNANHAQVGENNLESLKNFLAKHCI